MIVRELFAKLGFDVDEHSANKAEAAIEKIKHGLEALGVEEVLRRGYEFISEKFSEMAETALRFEQLSHKTGMGVVALQQLEYAAKLVEVESGTLQQGLVHLARSAQEAAISGGAAGATFFRLGIQVRGADGNLKPMNTLLGEVADRFQKMPDGAEKTAFAMDLFSRGGAAMVPLLNKGSDGLAKMGREANRTGAIMSEKMVEQNAKLAQALKYLQYTFTGLTYAILGPFVKSMTEGKHSFAEWIRQHQKLISMNVRQVVQGIAQAFEFASAAVHRFSVAFAVIGGAILAVTFPILTLIGVLGLLAEDVYSYTQGRDSLTGRLVYGFEMVATRIKAAFKNVADSMLNLIPQPILDLLNRIYGSGPTGPGMLALPGGGGASAPSTFLPSFLDRLDFIGLGPRISSMFGGGGGGSGPVSVTQHIYGGGDASEVANKTREQFEDWLDLKLREAKKF